MFKIIKIIVIVIIICTSLYAKTIKIAISNDMLPYSHINKNNKIEGLFVDYWLLWSKKTGINIEFVHSSWDDTLLAMENKKADVHSGLFKNDKRDNYLDFIETFYYSTSNIFVRFDSKTENFSDLKNKTIAFIKGTFYETYFKKRYPNINIKIYDSYETLSIALQTKKVDAIIDDNIAIWMNIKRHYAYNQIKRISNFDLYNGFYSAVLKNNNKLYEVIKEGMHLITSAEISEIEKKWILKKEFKIFKDVKKDLLNEEEQQFLNYNIKLEIAVVNNWEKLSFLNKENILVGYQIDYLEEINKILNSNIKIKEFSSWNEAYESVKTGEVKALFGLSYSRKREKFFYFTTSYYYSPFSIVVRNDDTSNSLDDFSNKIITSRENAITNKIVRRYAKNTNFLFKNTKNEMYEAIANKKADIALVANIKAKDVTKYNLKIAKEIYAKEGELYIGVEKSNKIFLEILNKAIKNISTSSLKKLENKWLKKENKLLSMLSNEEIEYIKNNPIINFSSIISAPFVFKDNGKIAGLLNDYLKLFENKLDIRFNFLLNNSHFELKKDFKEKKIDIIPSFSENISNNSKYLLSNKFASSKLAIVTNSKSDFVYSINALKGKTVVLIKNYPVYNLFRKHYKDFDTLVVNNVKEAFEAVLNGSVYAYVCLVETAVYNIKAKYPSLSISGFDERKYNFKFLMHKDKPILHSIINKIIHSLTSEEKEKISKKWTNFSIKTTIDYSLINKLIAIFSLLLVLVLLFLKRMSVAKNIITEQKNTFETLFNDSSDGILLLKKDKLFACNNACIKMLKYKNKEDLLKNKIFEISPVLQPDGEKSSIKSMKLCTQCLIEGTITFEWVHLKSTGEHLWLDVVLTRIVLNEEKIIHVVWRDIQEKKILEAQIKKRSEELEVANKNQLKIINDLKETQDKLVDSEKMASLGALVAGVSHEINTPVGISLTGITHFSDISKELKEKFNKDIMSEEDFKEYLNTSNDLAFLIRSNLEKAASLIRSFKQVAVDQSSEEKRKFELKSYLFEILASLNSITKKNNITINLDCEDDININSYAGSYSQIFSNLIMNSKIHGFENITNPQINILVTKNKNELKIIYKDNGKGIKKENLSKIFDPFFTTNRNEGGSGLGLNIIYNIITSKLKGSITCISEENKGVEFCIILNV